ncbi:MAG TPA: hypothetical protein VMJ34_18305, partial [Bryobacteraceae bacterium]|nr:hypothetical protein [Bryobacteraceae bacterium]
PTPAYRADLSFSRIDAASLVAATPALAGVTANSASGQISIRAAGANRADLLSSLTCQGNAHANLVRLLHAQQSTPGPRQPVPTEFLSADGVFSCAQRRITFQRLSLGVGIETSESGTGSIDFNRDLDLRFRSQSALVGDQVAPPPSFNLTGNLAAPQAVATPPAPRRSR